MKLSDYQLRSKMLEYIAEHSPVIQAFLADWNLRLGAGLSMSGELLYDLFGKSLESQHPDEYLELFPMEEEMAHLVIGIYVDPENPFGVQYIYKVYKQDMKFYRVFMIGEEKELIAYCHNQPISDGLL